MTERRCAAFAHLMKRKPLKYEYDAAPVEGTIIEGSQREKKMELCSSESGISEED